jgi:hypothetical protein
MVLPTGTFGSWFIYVSLKQEEIGYAKDFIFIAHSL